MMDLEEAIDRAITDMPENFLLKSFLEMHRAEVNGMLLTEYDEKETMELFKRDWKAEGRAEGKAEGRAEGKAEGRAEGKAEGKAEGEAKLSSLISTLLSLGRIQDIAKATKDPAYKEKLYAEFHI